MKLQQVMSLTRKAIDDYHMIDEEKISLMKDTAVY